MNKTHFPTSFLPKANTRGLEYIPALLGSAHEGLPEQVSLNPAL